MSFRRVILLKETGAEGGWKAIAPVHEPCYCAWMGKTVCLFDGWVAEFAFMKR